MRASCPTKLPTVADAPRPATPRKKIVEVWIARYRDSNPRIEGVMMRLFATVWKATVAMPWHTATMAIARTTKARRRASLQNTGVPNSAGFFHVMRPMQARSATAHTTPKRIHQRRRAAGDVNAAVRRAGRFVHADEAGAGAGEAASRRAGEVMTLTGRLPSSPGAARVR